MGETYPTIWDPDDVVVGDLTANTGDWLGAHPTRRSGAQRFWLTTLAVCSTIAGSGLVALGASLGLSAAGVDLPPISRQNLAIAAVTWLVALLGVAISIIGNAISRTRAVAARADQSTHLHRVALHEGVARVNSRRGEARTFGSLPPAPGAQPYGISERGAVDLAAAWLRHLGCAPTVSAVRTEGIDIRFGTCLVRVASRDEDAAASVRELAGSVAAHPNARGVAFFTRALGEDVTSFADRAGIALLVMNPVAGSLHGANLEGREIMKVSQRATERASTSPVPVMV
ncbi:hypothetical protein [Microbacterium terricola]|nr:hypothetical protein [Microbacterium terricola]UYK40829.1 hypothetical protein OAU46_04045 [Microbacterium terricola]